MGGVCRQRAMVPLLDHKLCPAGAGSAGRASGVGGGSSLIAAGPLRRWSRPRRSPPLRPPAPRRPRRTARPRSSSSPRQQRRRQEWQQRGTSQRGRRRRGAAQRGEQTRRPPRRRQLARGAQQRQRRGRATMGGACPCGNSRTPTQSGWARPTLRTLRWRALRWTQRVQQLRQAPRQCRCLARCRPAPQRRQPRPMGWGAVPAARTQ